MSTVAAMPRAEVSYDRIPLDRASSEMPLFVFSVLIALPIAAYVWQLDSWAEWLGLPAPLLWGVAVAILAAIPLLGPPVIWGPAAVYLGKLR